MKNQTVLKSEKAIAEQLTIMHHIDYVGNLKLHAWFQHIRLSGKPDSVAMDCLSEIVYWHRPTVVTNEASEIIGFKKRYAADLLQYSLGQFTDKFGFTKRQVSEALARLETLGLITRHYRTIVQNHVRSANVLYIDLHAKALSSISQLPPKSEDHKSDDSDAYFIPLEKPIPNTKAVSPVAPNHGIAHTSNEGGTTFKRDTSNVVCATNTKITQKIKTTTTDEREDIVSPSLSAVVVFPEKEKKADKPTAAVIESVCAASSPNTPTTVDEILPCMDWPLEDLTIASHLTTRQKAKIARELATLSFDEAKQKRLCSELELGLLDLKCFDRCGLDFLKKLKAILITVKNGTWTLPLRLQQRANTESEKHQNHEKKEIQALWLNWNNLSQHHNRLKQQLTSTPETSPYYAAIQKAYEQSSIDLNDAQDALKRMRHELDFELKEKEKCYA